MAEAFTIFYESWLAKLKELLQQLLTSSSDSSNAEYHHSDLVNQVLCHYKEFHDEKSKAINENPFLMISPPWLSPYEKILLWFSGFKPSMSLNLAKRALRETLSSSQLEIIEGMWADTKREEKEIEKVMASVQESMAAMPTYGLITRFGGLVGGEVSQLEEAMRMFKERVISVLEMADVLRGTTVSKLLEILSPLQVVRFLAAAAQFTVGTRRWGLERDNDPALSNGDVGASASHA
ncbi:OLC1v1019365C1 [Oldenlandia corymbosa var. corymbosa]|uniref:OLC1v1019365C1 n=1 Tax=Oldenlandia corymbosa var. corymbosa TaxID=529605 RepID=A0AAV1EDR4_OLDCO|nr:OLC1v1019365C1 [Oldenlandia corymbosa var. corymbosa]